MLKKDPVKDKTLKLDDIKKLHQKKYRQELGHFLVEGEHLILELEKAAKTNPLLASTKIYISESYGSFITALEQVTVSDKQMQKIAATKTPQGILAVIPLSALTALNQDTTGATRQRIQGTNARSICNEIQDSQSG